VTVYDVFQCLAGDAYDRYRYVVRKIDNCTFLVHWHIV